MKLGKKRLLPINLSDARCSEGGGDKPTSFITLKLYTLALNAIIEAARNFSIPHSVAEFRVWTRATACPHTKRAKLAGN